MKRFFLFLFGAMLGGLIGAAIILLLTPYSGEEARGHITGAAENMRKEIQLAAEKKRGQLEGELSRLRKSE
jgi:gas vesicle protein